MKTKERIALMGKLVTVTAVLCIKETGTRLYVRTWNSEPLASPRAGWVVGFTHRRNGTTSHHCGDEGPTFRPTACVPCVLVTFWPTHAPVEVPLDGYTLGGTPDNRTASWQDERVRNILREEAKRTPRIRGRFASGPLRPV